MSHQIVPETIDGKWTGRMLHLNANGEEVDPVTESVVQGTDAVVLELEQPKIIPASDDAPISDPVLLNAPIVVPDAPAVEVSPAAPEVAPASEEG